MPPETPAEDGPRPVFYTSSGERVPAVTADEMRAVDRVAVEEVGLQLLQMMENAGRGLSAVVRDRAPGEVLVVAGNGGNGGGGLACARHLDTHGVDVRVVLDRSQNDVTGTTATQLRILEGMDVPVHVTSDGLPELGAADVVVDALVGYGLDGPLRGTASAIVEALGLSAVTTVSLDVPSGIDATTGTKAGPAVSADHVATLALPKTGLSGYEGQLTLLDIGIPAVVYERLNIEYTNPFSDSDAVELRTHAS
jgi:NAD(P)H-hydrate epimerase